MACSDGSSSNKGGVSVERIYCKKVVPVHNTAMCQAEEAKRLMRNVRGPRKLDHRQAFTAACLVGSSRQPAGRRVTSFFKGRKIIPFSTS